MDLFLIVALIKSFAKGKKIKFRDVLGFKNVLVFLGFLTVVSLFQGLSIKTFISQPLRGLFFYSLFFSFPSLVNTRKNTIKFLYMFFPFVFMELFSQIYLLYTGQYLLGMFYSDSSALYVFRDKLMYDSIRSLAPGYAIVVLSFVFSLTLYDTVERMTPRYYLVVVMIIGSLSIFISATRQSIIMFGLMYFLYIFFVTKSKPSFVVQIVALLVVMFLIFDFMNVYDIGFTLDASLNRLTGAVQFQNGSLEAEDTLQYRLTYRLPILWEHIKASFLFGYGFSDDYFIYYDGHLGGIMIALLQAGVIGVAFYIYFIIKIYKVVFSYIRKFGKKISVTTTLKSLLIGVTGLVFLNLFINPMFVINFSSRPQESFILLVLIYQYIYFGKVEYMLKKRLKYSAAGNKKPLKSNNKLTK
ncbi:MAG: hypothetical protein LWX07_08335 [Bacteroidetes bacterium]|nr:hypothetical protein [Bacteroidota bacterium]